MTLLDDYNAMHGDPGFGDFSRKVYAAMAGEAASFLQGLAAGTDLTAAKENHRKARSARAILTGNDKNAHASARALIAAGVSTASTDAALTTAVANNFTALAFVWDADLDK